MHATSYSLHYAGRWVATIAVPGTSRTRIHLGTFDDEVTAAHAYDCEALQRGLEEKMNFPPEGVKSLLVGLAAPLGNSQYRGVSSNKTSGK